ncbi:MULTISPECIES: ribonuclease domain-containing protein [Paenarthrobacter]|uniref:Ribonuclease n=1 Tax=Paenarthrobacter ureafaciens TaxID=37931 RepID=A0AAX3EK51_PAEUR|nr:MULTISPECIES: ribonuclease domain-containing protein [Paenarthrobacter]NKR13478.1 ribonuclease [Arthrobacter sp. M5]NKR17203.1 ribonuclease [Arthrobacter sp. M6]OEH61881.1 ribonuclease [Arthrobacter sp. D4]OEH64183.1 ribonuclease [Arthrobacter sp. D2]MDO5863511.1 ribonuclease [Paenarthrobacter sp. SD-2]
MKRSRLAAFAGLVIAVVVLVVAMVSGQQAPTAPGESPGTAVSTTSAPPAVGQAPENPSGLPAVNASQLPKEARQTLALIAKGGPYPYDRDGVNFGNFEGLLPKKPGGFYKEYTVPTPGESDRGARRIIVGRDAAKYYTADHYESFKFIVEDK